MIVQTRPLLLLLVSQSAPLLQPPFPPTAPPFPIFFCPFEEPVCYHLCVKGVNLQVVASLFLILCFALVSKMQLRGERDHRYGGWYISEEAGSLHQESGAMLVDDLSASVS